MKKIISLLLVVGLVLSSATLTFANENEISVYVEGQKVSFDVPPQTINDRTMVPLRAIFEAMGAEIEWDGDTQTVAAVKDETVVVAVIGSNIIYVNDEEIIIDVPPMIKDGRTLVPVRFITEAFGYNVKWNEKTRSVIITSEEE